MRTRNSFKEELVRQKAIEMLVNMGIEGFGMNRLAKECDISVATLYIYYKDKEDLIKKIGVEIGTAFFAAMTIEFSPTMPFREGLSKQWENRAKHTMDHPLEVACWELLSHTSYRDYIVQHSLFDFKKIMNEFLSNAIAKKQLVSIPKEVFWSIAYGPLYTLLRFHNEGKSMSGAPFQLSTQAREQAFELVIKALTP